MSGLDFKSLLCLALITDHFPGDLAALTPPLGRLPGFFLFFHYALVAMTTTPATAAAPASFLIRSMSAVPAVTA